LISLRGKLDVHGVHGRGWSACVGCEDKKMAARLMKKSGATLMRDGGEVIGEKRRWREAWARSWIPGVREEEEERRNIGRFWGVGQQGAEQG